MTQEERKQLYESMIETMTKNKIKMFILIVPKLDDNNKLYGQHIMSNIRADQAQALLINAARVSPNRTRDFLYDKEDNQD